MWSGQGLGVRRGAARAGGTVVVGTVAHWPRARPWPPPANVRRVATRTTFEHRSTCACAPCRALLPLRRAVRVLSPLSRAQHRPRPGACAGPPHTAGTLNSSRGRSVGCRVCSLYSFPFSVHRTVSRVTREEHLLGRKHTAIPPPVHTGYIQTVHSVLHTLTLNTHFHIRSSNSSALVHTLCAVLRPPPASLQASPGPRTPSRPSPRPVPPLRAFACLRPPRPPSSLSVHRV